MAWIEATKNGIGPGYCLDLAGQAGTPDDRSRDQFPR